jgi:endo-1,4-beta-xylanase
MIFTRRAVSFALAAGAATAATACAASPAALAAKSADTSGLGLDAIAKTRGLRFGSAIKASQVAEADLIDVFNRECGVVVAENEFKWKQIERKPGVFRFGEADAIAKFAADNGHLLRGHTLCWNQDNRMPDWLLAAEPHLGKDKALQVEKMLIDYVGKMTARYPGVASWDVVNEAVQLQDGKIRDSFLTRTIGADFAQIMFHAAKNAAPNAELVYNDYMSWNPKSQHRDGVLRFLEKLVAAGAPIDALGVQSHLANSVEAHDEAAWRRFLAEVQGLGLKVIVTEIDCGDRDLASQDVAIRDAATAAHVKDYLDVTLSFPNVTQVVAWGMTDRESYVNAKYYPEARRRPDGLPQRPHPYDDAMKAKPLRRAIADALAAAPAR